MGSIEPDVQKARIGRSQPGVGLWSPYFFVLHFFESGLTLNPHNKHHSFGLFIPLYLCCVVDCINYYYFLNHKNKVISYCPNFVLQKKVTSNYYLD